MREEERLEVRRIQKGQRRRRDSDCYKTTTTKIGKSQSAHRQYQSRKRMRLSRKRRGRGDEPLNSTTPASSLDFPTVRPPSQVP